MMNKNLQIFHIIIKLIIIKYFLFMEPKPTLQQVMQFLLRIRKNIDNIQKQNALNILKQLNNRIQKYHLGIIFLFHNKYYLEKLLQELVKYHKNNKEKNEIQKQIQTIYSCGYSCFFMYEQGYKQVYSYFEGKISKQNVQNKEKDLRKNLGNFNQMSLIIKSFYDLYRQNIQQFEKGKKLNQFVQKLKKQVPATIYEEPIFTWLRNKIELLYNELIIKKKQSLPLGFCCRLHFQKNSTEAGIQTIAQNFSRFIDFKKSQDILKHIVSYLNSYGGIYYFGIEVSPNKKAQFYGIKVDQQNRKKNLIQLLRMILRIFPNDNENLQETDQQQQQRIQKYRHQKNTNFEKQSFQNGYFEYNLTKYMQVDFINLYDPQTWLYLREDNINLYIIRIKVKKGDQYEVYHYINQNQIPKAYYREDKKQKQLNMIQYYDQIYLKLKMKAENKHEQQTKFPSHFVCRFRMKIDKENQK